MEGGCLSQGPLSGGPNERPQGCPIGAGRSSQAGPPKCCMSAAGTGRTVCWGCTVMRASGPRFCHREFAIGGGYMLDFPKQASVYYEERWVMCHLCKGARRHLGSHMDEEFEKLINSIGIDRVNTDRQHLEKDDVCFFFEKYISGGTAEIPANKLFFDLNARLGQNDPNQNIRKENAIQECAAKIVKGLEPVDPKLLSLVTLVPIPPSRLMDHPDYDDRMLKLCKKVSDQSGIDVRELVFSKEYVDATHTGPQENRPTIAQVADNYRIAETIVAPEPLIIGIVDDMIASGGSFKAMQRVLQNRFPGCPIFGIFITRAERWGG